MLPGAALVVSAGRGSTSGSGQYPRGSTSGSGRYLSAFRGPPPGAALGSLAACFCWQGQHFRLWTVPELPGAALGSLAAGFCCSTSGSGRYPSAFRAPPLDAARRSTWQPRGSFLLAGAALQTLDSTRARFGAPLLLMLSGTALGSLAAGSGRYPSALPGAALGLAPPLLDAARRSTWELARAALQALGQHFRLCTVPERVSGPPPLDAARVSGPPP